MDVVLSGTDEHAHDILLIQRKSWPCTGEWALPGGFVDIDEDLEPAARRELREETGLEVGPLTQIGAWGRPDRDPRERVITVAFTGTVVGAQEPSAATDAVVAAWHPLADLPPLAFDHDEIVGAVFSRP